MDISDSFGKSVNELSAICKVVELGLTHDD
jgi:hypothetical protein